MSLDFLNLWVNQYAYEYWTSVKPGQASSADISSSYGNGSTLYVGNGGGDSVPISISALRDNLTEKTETAYLNIQLRGNVPFSDGSMFKVIPIQIIDDNKVTGGNGVDVLRGTTAAETLRGGLGNDHYYVTPGDIVIEASGAGLDTVFSAASYKLTANVENLTLTGNAAINGTGNTLANKLTGNAAANILDGNGGRDTLIGGRGDDTYITDGGDLIVESAGGGTDRVRSSISYSLGSNLENLTLTGNGNTYGRGNEAANAITGNAGNNTLYGFAGNDVLGGGAGADTLNGGLGRDWLDGGKDNVRDVFVFASARDSVKGGQRDVIVNFTHGVDQIDLHLIDPNRSAAGDQAFRFGGDQPTAYGLHLTRSGINTLVSGDITGDGVADFEISVRSLTALTASDFIL